ncbi:hypothetical protein AMK59_6268 [Oryctes borbonicus]|uniref:Uncharacterized protein n=1 Tax=Oryctes borbonicus TaxID=1629725 RepID=A0A0T6B377_9SCAR|nr:hypothetical protein AMK59_6268 [Oryctes borbonicus]
MSIGHEPLFCVSKYLLCDGNRNCPKGATKNDEDAKICKVWNILFREFKKSGADNKILNLLMSQTTKPPRVHPLWQDWTYIQRIDATTLTLTTTEAAPSNIESLSVALSHYGPWGYILLGMLICGTVLMFCGVWECFRKPKPTPPSESVPTIPTTVLIVDPPEASDLPRYDDIDPPAYSALFPTLKENDSDDINDASASSSIDGRQHSEIEGRHASDTQDTNSDNNTSNRVQTQIIRVNAPTDVSTETLSTNDIHQTEVHRRSDNTNENKVDDTRENTPPTNDTTSFSDASGV